MKKVHIDHVKTDDNTDAFMTVGWKRLVLKMFEISLRDMIGGDEVEQKAARNWFDPVMGRDAGVTFKDCVFAMGMASRIETVRQKALTHPKEMLADIEAAINSMSVEGVLRPREDTPPAGLQVDAEAIGSIQRAMFGHV
jgi:hypothetical protein